MIQRDAEPTIRTLLRGFPIVTITGPRQSGKTTLAKAIFSGKPYASLEDPDLRRAAFDDPRSFLDRFPDGAVLDEVQRCPELFSYLQSRVDGDGRMGLFILTGSQQFGLLSKVSQSLAGRTALVELLPFSLSELARGGKLPAQVGHLLHTGCYPPIHDRAVAPRAWFAAYTTSYIERDIRQMLKIQELETFHRFIRLCAGRTGQLLNLSALAGECGISHNTVKAWVSVLEASYIVFLLRPHHANFNKRLVKTPKLYFYDSGLASWLIGIRNREQLDTHPLRGNIFETFVISELIKSRLNQGESPGLCFWRDSNGVEVDVIAEQGPQLVPIEIKSGKTITNQAFTSLRRWRGLAGKLAGVPVLIYGGTENYRQSEVNVTGWEGAGKVLA